MCTAGCLDFVARRLTRAEIAGRAVIEVGSRDVNGSPRPLIMALGAAKYIGVDLEPGPGVDVICDATALVDRFGRESFDVVLSTELLEHVRSWRAVVSQWKHLLRPGGVLLVTTRSRGFPYHGFPDDYWRFEEDNLRVIFRDFEHDVLERDPGAPGVFLKARKPVNFQEANLDRHALFSIVTRQPAEEVSDSDLALFRRRRRRQDLLRAPERAFRRWRNRLWP